MALNLSSSPRRFQLSVSSHLKSNPRRYRRVICKSNPQRRVGYGEKKQMGIFQSHLSTVPQSQFGREDTNPRRVLRSLWLQPKECHHQVHRSLSRAEHSSQTTQAFFEVHFSGPVDPASHLGGVGLPLVSAAKSAPAALAALGQNTLFPLHTHRTEPPPILCAPDRSQIQSQKNPAQTAPLRTYQARHTAQTPYPHQNRL